MQKTIIHHRNCKEMPVTTHSTITDMIKSLTMAE